MKRLWAKAIVAVVFISISLSLLSAAQAAEISVESYCRLCIESMLQEVADLQELIVLVNQYRGDPALRVEKENIKQGEFQQAKDSLFASFGLDAFEYATYMGKHEQEVNAYLGKHPDIKKQIDDLAAQIKSLLGEYETTKGNQP